MKTEAQKRAHTAWIARHDLKRIELLLPADTVADIDGRAEGQGISRSKWLVAAIRLALDEDPPASGDDRLAAIESKVAALIASKVDTAVLDTEETSLSAAVQASRTDGASWPAIAADLNARGIRSPRGKAWTDATIRTHCARNGIA